MTIAVCYVSPEGVVLGADSTSSAFTSSGLHFFNHNQKVFELGENCTLGVVTWGLASIGETSHRTLLAQLADDIAANPVTTVEAAAQRMTDLFWNAYSSSPQITVAIQACQALNGKRPFDPAMPAAPDMRTQPEEQAFQTLKQILVLGFCIGGYCLPDRAPKAFQILFDPLGTKPAPTPSGYGYKFFGVPNMSHRLIDG